MEAFFRTHQYLIDHLYYPIERTLMDEIDWNHSFIGIKGSRGVGKTTFLLAYAKKYFGNDRSCLYINLNNFYFTSRSLVDFADEFYKKGGRTLLIDQVFKYPNWSIELRQIKDQITDLKIVFTGTTVMRLKEENPELSGKVAVYNLRGFSFREFVNFKANSDFPAYSLDEILANHRDISKSITTKVRPLAYFQDYLHHGYYPLFLEEANFSENLLKTINMVLEVDVTYLKQVELKYLPKLRLLLYLLASQAPATPNISQLAQQIETSRATVMNYIKYLKDARLFNLLYKSGEEFPKKPDMVFMHNTNLTFALNRDFSQQQALCKTFFYNMIHKDHKINSGINGNAFLIDNSLDFNIESSVKKVIQGNESYFAVDMIERGDKNVIPLWIFGFLY